jgi:hypothetical protein
LDVEGQAVESFLGRTRGIGKSDILELERGFPGSPLVQLQTRGIANIDGRLSFDLETEVSNGVDGLSGGEEMRYDAGECEEYVDVVVEYLTISSSPHCELTI